MPLSDQSSYGDKNQAWNRRILGLPSGVGISLKAASGKEQEMASGITCYLSDLWYYQTVTCIALSANRKWWLGAIFGVSVNLGPCYISVVFQGFCHCFFSVWECLIIHAADNWSLTLVCSACMLAHITVFWLTSHTVVFLEEPLVFIWSTVQHSVSYCLTQHGQYHHNHADPLSQFIFLYGFVGLSQFGNLGSHLYNV